jgi:hypothetical protein
VRTSAKTARLVLQQMGYQGFKKSHPLNPST